MEKSKRIIGCNSLGYPEIRNFAGLDFKKYKFEKKLNINKIPSWFYFKFKNKSDFYYLNSFRDFDLNNCQLYHFFNGISYGKKPWITTFEHLLPRWGSVPENKIIEGLELLASDPCKKIIAFSECNFKLQENFLHEKFPYFMDQIKSKMLILHPAQKLLINSLNEKPISKNKLIFTIIGAEFFIKGGQETLNAFEKVLQSGRKDVELNIVSSLIFGDYITFTTEKDFFGVKKIIEKYPLNIKHTFRLPNEKVMELLKKSNVALLPSYGDTYGYSVLEAQASGCPVITTDVRALHEINNQESGWIINVEKDAVFKANVTSEKTRKNFSENLTEELFKIFCSIYDNPSQIDKKGNEALKRIEKFHNPDEKAAVLSNIYDNIFDAANY